MVKSKFHLGLRLHLNPGNLLKPKLARGELRLVGATTLDEYKQYIEKDAAFERRLQASP